MKGFIAFVFMVFPLFADKDDLADLVAVATKAKKTADRVAAFKEIAKRGEDAKAATSAVCEVVSAGRGDLRVAALDCLEAIQPKLGPLVTTILVDGSLANQAEAAKKLATFNVEGTAPIFRKHLEILTASAKTETILPAWVQADIEGLEATAPDDPATLEVIMKHSRFWRERDAAAWSAFTVLMVQKAVRFGRRNEKQINGVLRDLFPFLSDPEPDVRLAAIEGFGMCGKAAKPSLPTLRKLKLDKDESVRTAARKAIELIDVD